MGQDDHDIQATDVFEEDCKAHEFPDQEIQNIRKLIADDRRCGQSVCIPLPGAGAALEVTELRFLPWLYEYKGDTACALILYLDIPKTRPVLLRHQMESSGHHWMKSIADPEKLARWVEAVLEIIDVITKSIA